MYLIFISTDVIVTDMLNFFSMPVTLSQQCMDDVKNMDLKSRNKILA